MKLKALAWGPVTAETGLAPGVEKEPSSGKGLCGMGCTRMLLAGLEKRGEADQRTGALGRRRPWTGAVYLVKGKGVPRCRGGKRWATPTFPREMRLAQRVE